MYKNKWQIHLFGVLLSMMMVVYTLNLKVGQRLDHQESAIGPNVFNSDLQYLYAVKHNTSLGITWPVYKASILGFYDDFEEAKRKLKKPEVHANLNTDVEKEKKSRKKWKKKTNVSSNDNSEPKVTSAIKIKPFPKPQQPSTLPQSLYLNESALKNYTLTESLSTFSVSTSSLITH